MKILHCADLHIREKDIEEIDRCLQMIVITAQQEKPDLAVIAGDMFDNRDVKVASLTAITAIGFVSALADVCPVAIVIGTPSHDGDSPRIMRYVRGEFPVLVAEKPMQVILSGSEFKSEEDNEGYGLQPDAILTLIPQPTKQYFQTQSDIKTADQEIGQAMSGLFMGFGARAAEYKCPHILVYHGGISGASLSTGQNLTGQDIEVSVDQLNMAGADLNLCGHIHAAQQLGDRTFYAGSPYRTNWGEMEPKGFWMHSEEACPGDVMRFQSRFIETPARRAIRFQRNLTDPENIEPMYADGVTGADVRIDLTVWQDEAEKIDKEAIRQEWLDQGAADVDIRIIRVPRENVRAAEVLKAETLRDKISRMAELRGEETTGSLLLKAELLEVKPADELTKAVAG